MATSIRLTPEIEQHLNFLTTSTGRSKAYHLREIADRGQLPFRPVLMTPEDKALVATVRERLVHPQRVKVSLDDL